MISVKETYKVAIEKLVYQGWGLGDIDGFKVFVPATVPGDIVNVKITKKKRRHAQAKVIDFIKKSDQRTINPCPHFPECGGCQMIDIPYPDQLQIKEQIFDDCITQFMPELLEKKKPLIPATSNTYYRNKMEFAFGGTTNNLTLGLKKRSTYDTVIPVSNCQLQSKQSNKILEDTVAYFNTTTLTPWNYDTNTGDLELLMVRHSKTHDTYMLMIIASQPFTEEIKTYCDTITEKHPNITSIYQRTADKVTHLFGDTHLHESLGPITYKISPQSFFQTNTKQAEILYQTIADTAQLSPTSTLLDLYCGTGTIGLFLANQVQTVTGIEEVAPAIEDAKDNATNNNISNATFRCGRVKNILKFEPLTADTIIIDPPRCGMVPKALNRMAAIGAPELIYVSCNPTTLLRDLIEITKLGYEVDTIQPVDMFPNTFHLECVTRLTKK